MTAVEIAEHALAVCRTRRAKRPLGPYFHSGRKSPGLYTFTKSEYSTAAVKISQGGGWPLTGRAQNDRTRDRTRGTSRDGIQRHKIRAVERTHDHAGRRGAQDDHSHPVEFAPGGQGQPPDDHRDGPGAEHPHVL